MPEPVDHIEGYIRTAEADSELRAPHLGLSLSQRKLLTLVEEGRRVAEMAVTLHSDESRVRRDLARLVELRLVRPPQAALPGKPAALPDKPAAPTTSAGTSTGIAATRSNGPGTNESARTSAARASLASTNPAPRLSHAVPSTRMAAAPHRLGIGIAVVALAGVAAVVVMAWPLRDHAVAESPTQVAAGSSTAAQPIAAPVDARTGSIRPAAAPPDEPAPAPAAERPVLVPTAMRVDARRPNPGEPGRAGVPAPQVAVAQPSPPREGARDNAKPSVPPDAPAPASPPPSQIASLASAPVNQPAAPAPHADDKTIAATLPERPPIAPPVVVPAPPAQAPAAAVPNAANRAEAPALVATAPQTSLAAPPKPKLTPIAREEPEFPRDALLENITSGRVRARLTIEKDGHVSGVQIVQAEPRRVFDRAVNRALSRWRFEAAGEVRTTEVEVDFRAN